MEIFMGTDTIYATVNVKVNESFDINFWPILP